MRQVFEKYSDTTFHQNLSYGSRVVTRGRTDMKLITAFRNLANAPGNKPTNKYSNNEVPQPPNTQSQ